MKNAEVLRVLQMASCWTIITITLRKADGGDYHQGARTAVESLMKTAGVTLMEPTRDIAEKFVRGEVIAAMTDMVVFKVDPRIDLDVLSRGLGTGIRQIGVAVSIEEQVAGGIYDLFVGPHLEAFGEFGWRLSHTLDPGRTLVIQVHSEGSELIGTIGITERMMVEVPHGTPTNIRAETATVYKAIMGAVALTRARE